MIFPAVHLQQKLRQSVLGEGYWQRMTLKRLQLHKSEHFHFLTAKSQMVSLSLVLTLCYCLTLTRLLSPQITHAPSSDSHHPRHLTPSTSNHPNQDDILFNVSGDPKQVHDKFLHAIVKYSSPELLQLPSSSQSQPGSRRPSKVAPSKSEKDKEEEEMLTEEQRMDPKLKIKPNTKDKDK